MATHSSILAWKIPWMEEPGRLQSMARVTESDMTEQLHFQTSLNIFKVHPSCSMCQNVISFQG